MASEVTSDLNSEISDLNNPCFSAFLAPRCFFEPFHRKEEGQNGLVDLRARSSPQITKHRNWGGIFRRLVEQNLDRTLLGCAQQSGWTQVNLTHFYAWNFLSFGRCWRGSKSSLAHHLHCSLKHYYPILVTWHHLALISCNRLTINPSAMMHW